MLYRNLNWIKYLNNSNILCNFYEKENKKKEKKRNLEKGIVTDNLYNSLKIVLKK